MKQHEAAYFESILRRVLDLPVGLKIRSKNRDALRRIFFAVKDGKPEFSTIQIILSPLEEDYLYVVNEAAYAEARAASNPRHDSGGRLQQASSAVPSGRVQPGDPEAGE
jgi:hypothetical protein